IPAPLRERRALIETEQRVRRLDLHFVEEFTRRLVLDDDRQVLHRLAESLRNRAESLLHETFELVALHARRRFDGGRPDLAFFAARFAGAAPFARASVLK